MFLKRGDFCMLAQWTGDLVGRMHINRITAKELAQHMGLRHEYVSAVLNGRRTPAGAEARFKAALDELITLRAECSTEIVR